jgi:2'-5' RNA ligase
MPESIRTFIAVEIPEAVRFAIGEIQEVLQSFKFNIKWVKPRSIHLTLKFLGNIDPAAVEAIDGVLQTTVESFEPFSIQAKDLGVFPGLMRPRVIWVGIAGQIDRLVGLQRNLDKNLNDIGFARDKRPFKGHLTLGRVKGSIDARRMGRVLTRYSQFEAQPFTVGSLILYKSELHPTGAVYTKLLEIAL